MDVKNKVDENVDENVVKEDTLTKLDSVERDLMYELGKLDGYLDSLMTILSNKHRNQTKKTIQRNNSQKL